jgi:glutamate racemase
MGFKMSSKQPIGVFDSGIGGLSVLKHIQALLPWENLIYVSDRAHLPYGNKAREVILKRSHNITRFLVKRRVKAIVIACNTATAVAVKQLRQTFSIPIVGMEPGVKPAIQQSKHGLIGVLATRGTLRSGKFQTLLRKHTNGSEVIICPCEGWVEAIEHLGPQHPKTQQLVSEHLQPILDTGIDILVLGCTHYPFLKSVIETIAGPKVSIIDTGTAVAKQLHHRLATLNLLCQNETPGMEEFWCSADPSQTQEVITRLRNGQTVQVLPLPNEPSEY